MKRRKFLLATAAVSATAVATYMARPYIRERLLPILDTTYPLGVLQDMEMRNIVALGEVVVAPGFVPPKDFFRDYVNSVTQKQHGFLKEYQRAAALLTRASAGLFGRDATRLQFADLPLPGRDKALQGLLWRYSGSDWIMPKAEKIAASRDALALRMYVMGPLIEHYYRSSYGWGVVGYRSFPGQPPLDPRAYTKPLGDKGEAS